MALTSLVVAPPSPAAAAAWRMRRRASPPPLLASASNGGGQPRPFERLREQLLQLHAEAELTQSKANSARVRLVRLTEAAENLKKRATTSVRMGKENEAVDLLIQKKKLTKALENIKERIELLDKLSVKISEAISMKQNMLIEHSLHPDTNGEDSNYQIRVISSKVDEGADETRDSLRELVDKGSSELEHANMTGHFEQREHDRAETITSPRDHGRIISIKNPSLYNVFLGHIDSQLESLENEIEQFTSSQIVEAAGDREQINSEEQKLSDILKRVAETRERIVSILHDRENGARAENLK